MVTLKVTDSLLKEGPHRIPPPPPPPPSIDQSRTAAHYLDVFFHFINEPTEREKKTRSSIGAVNGSLRQVNPQLRHDTGPKLPNWFTALQPPARPTEITIDLFQCQSGPTQRHRHRGHRRAIHINGTPKRSLELPHTPCNIPVSAV